MTDEPRRRDLVDLTPYLLGAEVGEGEGATAVPELLEVTFVRGSRGACSPRTRATEAGRPGVAGDAGASYGDGMDDLDIERLLDAGPRVGPTRAELQAAVAAAGNQHAAGFGERVLAALPQHYSMAEIMRALDGLGQVPHAGGGGGGS